MIEEQIRSDRQRIDLNRSTGAGRLASTASTDRQERTAEAVLYRSGSKTRRINQIQICTKNDIMNTGIETYNFVLMIGLPVTQLSVQAQLTATM